MNPEEWSKSLKRDYEQHIVDIPFEGVFPQIRKRLDSEIITELPVECGWITKIVIKGANPISLSTDKIIFMIRKEDFNTENGMTILTINFPANLAYGCNPKLVCDSVPNSIETFGYDVSVDLIYPIFHIYDNAAHRVKICICEDGKIFPISW